MLHENAKRLVLIISDEHVRKNDDAFRQEDEAETLVYEIRTGYKPQGYPTTLRGFTKEVRYERMPEQNRVIALL